MNDYLKRQAEHDKALTQTMERVVKQLCIDVMQVTLHEDFGMGYERLTKVTEGFVRRFGDYVQALLGGDEHDVWQERLDRALLDIVKDESKLMPFRERYPEVRRHGYDKPLRKRR
jgi:hypothetical protein